MDLPRNRNGSPRSFNESRNEYLAKRTEILEEHCRKASCTFRNRAEQHQPAEGPRVLENISSSHFRPGTPITTLAGIVLHPTQARLSNASLGMLLQNAPRTSACMPTSAPLSCGSLALECPKKSSASKPKNVARTTQGEELQICGQSIYISQEFEFCSS